MVALAKIAILRQLDELLSEKKTLSLICYRSYLAISTINEYSHSSLRSGWAE